MMTTGLSVTTWVTIDEDCSISYDVTGSAQTDFVFCDESFGIAMEADALREFLRVGTKALDEMDALYAREQAEETSG